MQQSRHNDQPTTVAGLTSDRPLRVVALVKQVPVVESMTLGPDGRLQRDGAELELNPYCRRAVSKGVEIARATGGTCTVVTMGPPSAEDALREAVAWGADDALHLCDPAFAGSDTLATARALAAAITRLGPVDLVLVGRNSIDGDTGQVGPEVAELLGLPFACGVRVLGGAAPELLVRLEHDDGWDEAALRLPAVLSVAERLCEPAKVAPEGRAAVGPAAIRTVTAADLGDGPWGEQGSPTRVGAVRTMEHHRDRRVLTGPIAEQVAEAVALLEPRNALPAGAPSGDAVTLPTAPASPAASFQTTAATPAPTNPTGAAPAPAPPPTSQTAAWPTNPTGATSAPPDRTGTRAAAVGVLLEPGRSQVGAELLGAAARLAQAIAGRVVALAPDGALHVAPDGAAALGAPDQYADGIVRLPGELAEEDVASAVAQWARDEAPWAILCPSTAYGREVAARAAAALGVGLVGDAIGLEVRNGRLVAAKPAFSGALVADITCTTPIQMATVRPGVLPVSAPRPATIPVHRRTLRVQPARRVRLLTRHRDDDVELLARAEVVVGVGTGVDPVEYPLLDPLLAALGAELAATRKVTDRGWQPRARQVGITGRSIAPRLYLAIGLGGKINHMVGVRAAGTVLAINQDPDALVFHHADLGLVGDWHEIVPALVTALRARQGWPLGGGSRRSALAGAGGRHSR